jgi:hypothetical protein
MSSRVFKARTAHTAENPQICGLTDVEISEGDWCFYLVCGGDKAKPEFQVRVVREEETTYRGRKRTKKIHETPKAIPCRVEGGRTIYADKWHNVCTGQWEVYEKPDGSKGRRKVFEWQIEDPDTGARYPVEVWSNMVLASAAEKLGYHVLKDAKGRYRTTVAHQGDRTQGHEHRIADEAEPAMVTLAKAAMSPEEAGEVAPEVTPEGVA